jgi:hypothetical protein
MHRWGTMRQRPLCPAAMTYFMFKYSVLLRCPEAVNGKARQYEKGHTTSFCRGRQSEIVTSKSSKEKLSHFSNVTAICYF